jgi:hypothetical protein
MKVYVLTKGEYEDLAIVGVTSDLGQAEEWKRAGDPPAPENGWRGWTNDYYGPYENGVIEGY